MLVKCHEKCKTCSQLGDETFYYCVECSDDYNYNFNNGEKCLDHYENYEEEEYTDIRDDNYQYYLSSYPYTDEEFISELTSKNENFSSSSVLNLSEIYYKDEYFYSLNDKCPEEYRFLILERRECITDCKYDKIYNYGYDNRCYIK